ncbi:tetratricopeptide repeat protein [Vibrio artabrorum]|uniref:tetratricopeptide repeat protein n=1 Tax=Vibrio artabrorum TaxID=446374 RepID=UPI0035505DB6
MMKQIWILVGVLLMPLTTQAQALSQYTAIRVQKAYQLAQDEQVKQAIDVLADLDLSKGYDKAYVARMLGVFYWQDGKTDAAIKQLTYAVDTHLLVDEQAWVTKRMLADLLLNDQQCKKALRYYYELVKTAPEKEKKDTLWMRIAQAEYQMKNWSKVLVAIGNHDKFNSKPELSPLSLKLGAQLQLKQWKPSIPTLESLIELQPEKDNWWRQLVGIQLRLDRYRDALNTLALADLQGVELKKSDRRLLAQLYAKRGIPERAAQEIAKLDDANSDVQLLAEQATYWQLAKEWDNAIKVWTLASQKDAQYHWNVAQLLVQQGYYDRALLVLDKVKDKNKQADVALAKVRSWYKLKKLDNALAQAKRANNIEPSSEAQGWIKYLTQLRKVSDKGNV